MEVENSVETMNGHHNHSSSGNTSKDGIKVPNTPVDSPSDRKNKNKVKRAQRQGSREGAATILNGSGGATSSNGLVNVYCAPQRRWKNSRRSRNSYGRGLPKKGGAGGKGVWGQFGSELLAEEDIEDRDDPNYDSEINDKNTELLVVIPEPTPEEFRSQLEPIMLEYFENGDTHEVAISLDEILVGNLRQCVTAFAVEISMDHKDSHREMTSLLISDLYGRVITPKDIIKGEKNLTFFFYFIYQ